MAERGLLNPERTMGGQANDWSIEAFQNGTGAINLYGSCHIGLLSCCCACTPSFPTK